MGTSYPETPLEESLAAIKEYCDSGNIRHVGLSEVGIDQIERAREIVPITAVQNQYNLSELRGRRRPLRRRRDRIRALPPAAR
jgi:aryl-alcohol dehydrogenase-like predicted oxidoreductase